MTVYGGQAYSVQIGKLQRGVDIVVGTPGRLLDLCVRSCWISAMSDTWWLTKPICSNGLPRKCRNHSRGNSRRPPNRAFLGHDARSDSPAGRTVPQRSAQTTIQPEQRTVSGIEQRFCRIRQDDKPAALVDLLEMEDVTGALIFTHTNASAQELADDLQGSGYSAEALHGDLDQTRRHRCSALSQHMLNIVVATDVAARGLDIQGVSHVFNLDFPHDAEDYIHRVGRAGRAGGNGHRITFLTPRNEGF